MRRWQCDTHVHLEKAGKLRQMEREDGKKWVDGEGWRNSRAAYQGGRIYRRVGQGDRSKRRRICSDLRIGSSLYVYVCVWEFFLV